VAIFQIYDKDDSEPVAVKQGFNFNAFVAIFIWALFKRLWLVGITGAILWITYQSYQAQFSIFISSLLPIEDDYSSLAISTFIVFTIPHFIFGSLGSQLIEDDLTDSGYTIAQIVEADNAEKALNEYSGQESKEKEKTSKVLKRVNIKKVRITSHTSKATNENTSPRKPLPSKISSQTLFIRQKREINRKLKQKLITKRTADTQMKKAVELEEMRLIIENKGKKPEVKKKVKPKKIASKSKDEFNYIEKLKDITTLKEEGAISQAEFRRLKKKIMDTI
jgi:hypothetical protein